jgi:hypothetical protein
MTRGPIALRNGRLAALPLLLRQLGDDMLDLDDGHLDRSLLFLAAEYIEELEAALAKIGRALGNCT